MRLLALLMLFIWRQFLEWIAWRVFLLTMVLSQIVTPLIGLTVWSVALPNSGTISTYYIALFVIQLLTVSYEHHTLSNVIYEGNLSHDLLKPAPVVIGPLGTNLALRLWHLLIGLPFIIIVNWSFGSSFDLKMIVPALPALVLAATLRFLFTYTLALSAFWTTRAHGIVGIGEQMLFLLGGTAAPVVLFPEQLRPWAIALPFRNMLGFPAEIMSRSLDQAQIVQGYQWQLFWIMVMAIAAAFFWRLGLQRYTAVGG
ncbi:ABC transporter permease [Reticulibacter mediterranei]|uniref:ABC transporter permease n=1 Tax=Reticulibacter mediterranei TaxID=2778369 RepID=A0A8J3IZ90_9CHLR|nr:ABC-2 family transporter protein [Reticulibacter mediterranei]GHO99492.1 ABC transporter permease [Reticulibacter mediterranei]